MRIALLLLIALPALGKSLHWRAIDVQARLDGQGRLHVVERQTMLFDGDWNGGERDFNLRNRQKLVLHRLARVEDGREIPLVADDLDAVDHYDFTSKSVLRWRSRMPDDPPFESRELTYVLDYTYENVLEVDGSTLVFWHDFGLPERQGVIDVFTLKLEFDPVWQTAPVSETRSAVQPGQSVVIRRDFVKAPAALVELIQVVPPWVPTSLLGAFAAAIAIMIAMFFRAESELGRFARVAPALDEEVLALRAEVVGAIWDADIGPPEVAATLARLEQEGKITTRVEKKVLHMKLNVSPSGMTGYERNLVAKIFGGNDTMDTKRLKKRYKNSGFDPAGEITPGIETAISDVLPGWNAKTRRFRRMSHVVTLAGAALLLAGIALLGEEESVAAMLLALCFGGVFGFFACLLAYLRSRAIARLGRAFLAPALLLAIPILIFWSSATRALPMGRISLPLTIGIGLWVLAIVRLALDMLKIREPRNVIAMRNRVVALRKFFVQELRKPQPALRDEWFPYLLAFGLGKNADRWFRAFGSAASHVSSSSSSGWSGSSSSSSSWTGGGGSFGGAGATGSWAVAAAGVAAGVASPGSSSGGGGGGGGSSSGGGGGGGW
ncbi:MAG TPA: DUF2207 domain-containing protein [Thermoanaerobaculia bacterium]|jgi:uncharacterized membrane protein YgcG